MKSVLKIAVAMAAFLVIFLSRGCLAADWPTQYSNNQNNPLVFDTFRTGSNSQTVDLGSSTTVQYYVIGDGMVYSTTGFYGKEIVAINLSSGQIIWQKTFPRAVSNLIYDSNRLYFAADEFYALNDSDGSTVWKSSICGTKTCKALRIENDTVFAAVSTSYPSAHAITLDKNTGFLISENSTNSITMNTDVVLNDSAVYYMSQAGSSANTTVLALNKIDLSLIKQFANCPVRAYGGLLDVDNSKLYLSANGRLCTYDLLSFDMDTNFTSNTYGGFVKYGDTIYEKGNYSLMAFDAGDGDPHPSFVRTIGSIPYSNPLVVNGVLYYGTDTGRIWGTNLETGAEKVWTIDAESAITHLEYADGKFVISSRAGIVNKLFIMDANYLSLRPNDFTVTLDSPYKTDGNYIPYLGQLHAHYMPEAPENWLLTYGQYLYSAYDVEKRYKDAGYDFVAITEHNKLTENPGVEDMLHISDAEEDTQSFPGNHILAIGTNILVDESQSSQNRIDQIVFQGGIPVLAHPNEIIYRWTNNQISNLRDVNLIEGFNSAVSRGLPFADAFDKIDKFSDKLFATAGDDFTPDLPGFDGGAVVVFSKSRSQSEILQNLKDGNFYALQGSQAPRITVNVSDNQITINSDKQSKIKFIGNGGKTLQQVSNVSSSTYIATGDEIYVRAEIEASGKTSWTQPIKVNKVDNSQTLTSGEHYTDLGLAGLASNSSGPINASILSSSQYPANTPPLGYFSPVYAFETSGQVLSGTNLLVSYAGRKIPTNEDNLAIYTYDQANSVWQRVTSYVDKVNKTVSANLPHFSLYTLSAEQPEDTEQPMISLAAPVDLDNLSGQIDFVANASDDNAVTEVRFIIDDKAIAKDTDNDDGWSTNIDSNDIALGNHKLSIEAEDFSGNVGTSEINFNISESNFVAPAVSISSPTQDQYLHTTFNITGGFVNTNDVKSISVYLNDVYITDADLVENSFSKEIDFSQFKEGNHSLKVILVDSKDNSAESTININIGEELKVVIASPIEKTYMHSGEILFQYQTTLGDAVGVVAKLDGQVIPNGTLKNAFELSLGQHVYTIEKNGKVYAETNFTVSTNLIDQIKLVEKLYGLGHIKNHGITTSIQAHLVMGEIFDKFGMRKLRDQFIQKAISFIVQQNEKKKPLVDNLARNYTITDLYFIRSN